MMEVVSGALIRNGQLLIGQRWGSRVGRWSNMWEIAGGKVRHGETHGEALKRELQEEYGFESTRVAAEPLHSVILDMPTHAEYAGAKYSVTTYRVFTEEIPKLLVHQGIKWATKADVERLPCLSSLISILERSGRGQGLILDEWR